MKTWTISEVAMVAIAVIFLIYLIHNW